MDPQFKVATDKKETGTSESDQQVCRVCLEEGSKEKLVSPCRCSGSLKHIHEDCLKTWLAAKNQDMAEARCEICHTTFHMEFSVKHQCVPSQVCKRSQLQCVFLPMLLAVECMLCVIFYFLLLSYSAASTSGPEAAYMIALMVICVAASLVISVLITTTFKEACIATNVVHWKIFDQHFKDELVIDDPSALLNVAPVVPRPGPTMIRLRGRRVHTVIGERPVQVEVQSAVLRSEPSEPENTPADNAEPQSAGILAFVGGGIN